MCSKRTNEVCPFKTLQDVLFVKLARVFCRIWTFSFTCLAIHQPCVLQVLPAATSWLIRVALESCIRESHNRFICTKPLLSKAQNPKTDSELVGKDDGAHKKTFYRSIQQNTNNWSKPKRMTPKVRVSYPCILGQDVVILRYPDHSIANNQQLADWSGFTVAQNICYRLQLGKTFFDDLLRNKEILKPAYPEYCHGTIKR